MLEKSVYSRLLEDILSSAITPEETLTEVKLTERYGAPHPVREALQRLEQDGLLERRGKVLAVRTTRPRRSWTSTSRGSCWRRRPRPRRAEAHGPGRPVAAGKVPGMRVGSGRRAGAGRGNREFTA